MAKAQQRASAQDSEPSAPQVVDLLAELEKARVESMAFHRAVIDRLFGIIERMVGGKVPPSPQVMRAPEGSTTHVGIPPSLLKGGGRGQQPKITES